MNISQTSKDLYPDPISWFQKLFMPTQRKITHTYRIPRRGVLFKKKVRSQPGNPVQMGNGRGGGRPYTKGAWIQGWRMVNPRLLPRSQDPCLKIIWGWNLNSFRLLRHNETKTGCSMHLSCNRVKRKFWVLKKWAASWVVWDQGPQEFFSQFPSQQLLKNVEY